MSADWHKLRAELAVWRDLDLELPLWWRDDDAVDATPALDRLCEAAARAGMAVHLAVIPEHATPALANKVADAPHLIPVLHGRAHRNHAAAGQKKAELGPHRPAARMAAELDAGAVRLRGLFGARIADMLVPPWNRIAPDLVALLPGLGLRTLSTFGPRKDANPVTGLTQVNTHLDPIDWHGTRGLVDADRLIGQTVENLRARRTGTTDAAEPFGLLTHHLVHDAAIDAFVARWIDEIRAGPVRLWTHPTGESA